MTDNELLLAISEMLDKKLDSELKPVKNDIHSIQDNMHSMQNEICSMRNDINSMQNDICSMQNDICSMQNDINSMQNDMHSMKMFQENIILPRLNTIESCYTDTYDRYKNHADKMEAVFSDVELLKKVVSAHSEKLQKIV